MLHQRHVDLAGFDAWHDEIDDIFFKKRIVRPNDKMEWIQPMIYVPILFCYLQVPVLAIFCFQVRLLDCEQKSAENRKKQIVRMPL